MAQSLSDEEFSRMQTQLIELRTLNYELEVNCQRQQAELSQLQGKYINQEKELLKTSKIINKSKNKKEYAVLLEENENLQRQFQAQEENFKLQNQTLMEEISKLNDDNEKLQKQVAERNGAQDFGSEAEIRRIRAENAALQKSLTSCQDKFEKELSQLRGRLQSLSDEHIENYSESKINEPQNGNATEDGVQCNETDSGYATNRVEQTEISEKLHEILNREFSVFSEKMFCSRMGDVSREHEMNQRHQVAKGSDQNNEDDDDENAMDRNSGDKSSKESENSQISLAYHEQSQEGITDLKSEKRFVDQEYSSEVENLKRNLTESLTPLLQATEDMFNRTATTRSPTRECLQEAETRSMALEKQVKEMSGLQLQLDTEREEKRMLQEQLHEAESSRKQEISRLEGELSKLADKVKRKQESYLQLQEEKEKLYSENKKALEDLKASKEQELQILTEQMAKVQDELLVANKLCMDYKEETERRIKGLEEKIASQQNQASSTAEEAGQLMAGFRAENAALAAELQVVKEKCKTITEEQEESEDLISQLENKVSLSETRCAELALEVDELHAHVKEQDTAAERFNEQIAQLISERDQLAASFQEVSKVAESRKNLVDEMAIEKQKADTTHREQLEKLQEEHKKELADIRDQLTGEKKLRKDLEDSQQKLTEAKFKIQSLESKSGWFERRLTETEEILKAEKEQNEASLGELQKERENKLEAIKEERKKESQEFQSQITALRDELEEKGQQMENLHQDLKDKEVENRIAGKKGDQLVKDLKRQLKLERKRAEQLQQRLQEALSENRVKPAFEDLFSPKEMQRRNSGDSSVLSHPSRSEMDSPEFRPPSPAASTVSMLNDDTTDLIERLADVQQEKWLLEEKVRHLEENGAALAEDLIQKSAIIQAYAMETKLGPVAESPKPSSTPMSSLKDKIRSPFGKGKSESTRKIQLMLEETLTKNVQLQQDMDAMSKELEKLRQEESATKNSGEIPETIAVTSSPQQTEEQETGTS